MSALTALGAVFIAGCSSSPSAAPASSAGTPLTASTTARATAVGGKITIDTNDRLMFVPSVVTSGVGTLRVTLTNSGSYPHNLDVPGLHVRSHTVTGGPGSTSTTVTLHFAKPGRYTFICTYHASAGMRGEFIVK